MFSTSSKYAIKAVLYLALKTNEKKKITVKEIAEPINVPKAYIAKLLQELSRQKIISSTRGPKGGFYLSDENKKQPLINIISALKGEEKMHNCLLNLKHCNEAKPCPLHELASPLRSKLFKNLNSKTIQEISEEINRGEVFLPI